MADVKKKLKPRVKEHDDLVSLIMDLASHSYSIMSNRHDYWDEIDKSLKAYVDLSDEEKQVLDKDKRKPTSIVVPIMFASIETILTYLTAAFIVDPMFKYQGVDKNDFAGTALLELLVQRQVNKAKVPLYLHTIWRDALAYGIGVGIVGFETVTKKKTVREDSIVSKISSLFPSISYIKSRYDVVDQTSTLYSVDPYLFLPDVNLPLTDVQRMNYVGWIDRDTYYNLLMESKEDDSLFNIDYLKNVVDGRLRFIDRDLTYNPTFKSDISKPIDVVYMYMKIVPSEYGLSNSNNVERWFFAVAAGEVLIKAEKLDLDHGMFPIVTTSPDYDGHSTDPTSRLEVLYGMQRTIDWLFSSHITNVRKAINDMLVVDPYLININDLKNPEAGRLIRLRKSAWGRGVSGAVEQLKVTDVTRNNINDALFLLDIIQRVSGATDMVQGIMRTSGERRSATEAAGVRESSLTRLEHIAKMISYQMMQDIGYMFASQTIQLMSDTVIDKIASGVAEQLKAEYGVDKVNAKLLDIDFDVKIHDGSMPNIGNGQLWVELFRILTQTPDIAQSFDLLRIFKHVSRLLGAKDVDSFVRKNVEVVDPEKLNKGIQSGQYVPVDEYEDVVGINNEGDNDEYPVE